MNRVDLAYKYLDSVFDGKSNTKDFLNQTEQKLIALLDGATLTEEGAIVGCVESIAMLQGGAPDAQGR